MSFSSAGTATSPDTFGVGNVLNRSMGVFSRHFALFFLVAAASQITPLLGLFITPVRHPPGAGTMASYGIIGFLVVLVLMPIVQTIIYHAAFQDMLARPIRFNDSLAYALRRFLPVLGTMICMGVAIGFGCVLLLVPGIILAIVLAVAVPASVVEQSGPFASLARSSELTKGNRWQIFGIGLVLVVASIASSGVAVVCRLVLGAVLGGLLGLAAQILVSAYFSVVGAVLYHDLRVAKEGVDTGRIAAVFD